MGEDDELKVRFTCYPTTKSKTTEKSTRLSTVLIISSHYLIFVKYPQQAIRWCTQTGLNGFTLSFFTSKWLPVQLFLHTGSLPTFVINDRHIALHKDLLRLYNTSSIDAVLWRRWFIKDTGAGVQHGSRAGVDRPGPLESRLLLFLVQCAGSRCFASRTYLVP